MSNVCLVIIYNHNFEKNIPVLNRVYAGRFSDVYHVMPFYQGEDPHVIGVYECSYQFQGYITQAISKLKKDGYSHFVFVADDMVIRPDLNERNIVEALRLDSETSFISELNMVTDDRFAKWSWGRQSTINFNAKGNACEGLKFLPSLEIARRSFELHRLNWRKGVSARLYEIYRKVMARRYLISFLPIIEKVFKCFKSSDKVYPLAYGYSDFIVVPKDALNLFCHYSGILAGMRVFVEVAIPTSLILSSKRIMTLDQLGLSCEMGVDNYVVREKFEKQCQMNYKRLLEIFPKDYLFIHPVKLSKWKDLP